MKRRLYLCHERNGSNLFAILQNRQFMDDLITNNCSMNDDERRSRTREPNLQ